MLGDVPEFVALGTIEGAGPAYLSSLRQALVRWRRGMQGSKERDWLREMRRGRDGRVWIGLSQASEEELHLKLRNLGDVKVMEDFVKTPPTSPAIYLEGDRLRTRIERWQSDKPDPAMVRRLLAPLLERHRADCEIGTAAVKEGEGSGFTVTVDIDRSSPRGATVAEAWLVGEQALALLGAAEDGEISQSAALDLLHAGRWDLFRGQPESAWLEAKGAPYDHLGSNWQYELAKDVAIFANSRRGGIVVLGMTTLDQGDGDTIRGYKEFELSRVRRQSYRNVVAQRIYPRVAGFDVHRIEGSKRKGFGLAVLSIPPQPESSRPFLVHGTLSRGDVLGAHVLLPVRREDETALMDVAALHVRIGLGEQVIAGKKHLR
jgi:hypothetical protein